MANTRRIMKNGASSCTMAAVWFRFQTTQFFLSMATSWMRKSVKPCAFAISTLSSDSPRGYRWWHLNQRNLKNLIILRKGFVAKNPAILF